jgi:hypothetical protein
MKHVLEFFLTLFFPVVDEPSEMDTVQLGSIIHDPSLAINKGLSFLAYVGKVASSYVSSFTEVNKKRTVKYTPFITYFI